MRIFYKILIISGLIIILPVAILFIYLTYKIPFNNYRLKIFQESFNTFINPMHPQQSNLIAELAEIGNWTDGT